MANEANIRKVIEMIKNEAYYFNMSDWCLNEIEVARYDARYPDNICGTPACIGGWAQAIRKQEQIESGEVRTVDFGTDADDWLGLTEDETEALFYPETDAEWKDITREQAIAHLEHIIETGEVNWKKFVA